MDLLKKGTSKVLGLFALGAVATTNAYSAVAYTVATGFTGSLDMTAYETAVVIVIAVVAVIIATTLGIKALKSAKSA